MNQYAYLALSRYEHKNFKAMEREETEMYITK